MKRPKRIDSTDRADLLQAMAEAFHAEQRRGLSKTAQLYHAVARLIARGALREGEKLPGERELCAALGISLGTAQKSLNRLMADGEVVREHGRGTFVRSARQELNQLWHYRFRDPATGSLFPVYARLLDRELVPGDPTIVRALGRAEDRYVRVRRIVSIGQRFSCWSEMYLNGVRFAKLLKLRLTDLESVNLKQILAEQFDTPTLAVTQTAKLLKPPRDAAKAIGVARGTWCLALQIVATSRGGEPITYQRILVPPTEYDLEFPDVPVSPSQALAA